MKQIIMIAGLLLLAGPVIAQIVYNKDNLPKLYNAKGEEIALSRIGNTRIVLKDRTIRKDCILKEIKTNWIVYMKDRVLHDMMIDAIKWIELEDGTSAIYFDVKNNPIIKNIE